MQTMFSRDVKLNIHTQITRANESEREREKKAHTHMLFRYIYQKKKIFIVENC
jgi:hypothetical protein